MAPTAASFKLSRRSRWTWSGPWSDALAALATAAASAALVLIVPPAESTLNLKLAGTISWLPESFALRDHFALVASPNLNRAAAEPAKAWLLAFSALAGSWWTRARGRRRAGSAGWQPWGGVMPSFSSSMRSSASGCVQRFIVGRAQVRRQQIGTAPQGPLRERGR